MRRRKNRTGRGEGSFYPNFKGMTIAPHTVHFCLRCGRTYPCPASKGCDIGEYVYPCPKHVLSGEESRGDEVEDRRERDEQSVRPQTDSTR